SFSSHITEFAVAPDDKHVAFAIQGELFLMPMTSDARVTRLTETPANDHGIAWAPDGSRMVFLSDRDSQEDLYLLEPNDPDHPKCTGPHRSNVTRLPAPGEADPGPSSAPTAKRAASRRPGRLWTMTPDGSAARVVVNEPPVFDYEGSPDPRWIVSARRDGSFA